MLSIGLALGSEGLALGSVGIRRELSTGTCLTEAGIKPGTLESELSEEHRCSITSIWQPPWLVHFVGRTAPKMNLGRVTAGTVACWLEGEARKSILGKVRAEARGPATRCKNQPLQD
jgi:hypothetical protein